ncbi:MAG: YihY/virulence factor BrkB family protein [Clostridia bacterium]|nr:YihY/virulence factor BrkB family protein [Clostridia bacterium]
MANKFSACAKKFKHFLDEFLEGDFFGIAAEMSFYLLSSFLPMLIFVFTVTSSISESYTNVMLNAIGVLPDKIGNLLIDMLVNRTTSTTVMLITGAFSLFTMSGYILTAEKGLNRFYKTERERGFFSSNTLAVVFAFFILISIIASFALIIFGGVITDYLFSKPSLSYLMPIWDKLRHIIVLIFISLIISALYKVLPTIKLKFRKVLPGAAFTTIGWYAASSLFALYVNNFPQYEIIYGSLAGFACMIMWIYLTGIIVMIGAKINALIYLHQVAKEEKLHEVQLEPAETVAENKAIEPIAEKEVVSRNVD